MNMCVGGISPSELAAFTDFPAEEPISSRRPSRDEKSHASLHNVSACSALGLKP